MPRYNDGRESVISRAWSAWFRQLHAIIADDEPGFAYRLAARLDDRIARSRIGAWLAGKTDPVGAEVAYRVGAAFPETIDAEHPFLASGPIALFAARRVLDGMAFLAKLALGGKDGARHAVALYRLLPAYLHWIDHADGEEERYRVLRSAAHVELVALHREPGALARYDAAFDARDVQPEAFRSHPSALAYDHAAKLIATARAGRIPYKQLVQTMPGQLDLWAPPVDAKAFEQYAYIDAPYRLYAARDQLVREDAVRRMLAPLPVDAIQFGGPPPDVTIWAKAKTEETTTKHD